MDTNRHLIRLGLGLLLALGPAAAQSQLRNHPFQVIERHYDEAAERTIHRLRPVLGNERTNNSLNRLTLLSENQLDYPAPESGCGPTAMLNILIWYEKYGLIESRNNSPDPDAYKFALFREIDTRLAESAGRPRDDETGTSNADVALVMDQFIREGSGGRLRMHTTYVEAPLRLKHFLETMPNFRSGYLVVRPKDSQTGELRNSHAVTFVRADRAGNLTLSTWGQQYHGILKKRDGQQWFIPSDPGHLELQITGMIQFIPFEPVHAGL